MVHRVAAPAKKVVVVPIWNAPERAMTPLCHLAVMRWAWWFAHLFCTELNMHDRNKEQYLLSIILDLGGFFFLGGVRIL